MKKMRVVINLNKSNFYCVLMGRKLLIILVLQAKLEDYVKFNPCPGRLFLQYLIY